MVDLARFEPALGRLEAIVRELESGELTLERSLALFEEGVKLARECSAILEAADRKIEMLTEGPDGRLQLGPLEAAEEG
ncbi:MAG: exodeoxyribonuclease VII small subunit [bacterium]|nr:exodeoxyribonuclease VII small subunit [bacterium]